MIDKKDFIKKFDFCLWWALPTANFYQLHYMTICIIFINITVDIIVIMVIIVLCNSLTSAFGDGAGVTAWIDRTEGGYKCVIVIIDIIIVIFTIIIVIKKGTFWILKVYNMRLLWDSTKSLILTSPNVYLKSLQIRLLWNFTKPITNTTFILHRKKEKKRPTLSLKVSRVGVLWDSSKSTIIFTTILKAKQRRREQLKSFQIRLLWDSSVSPKSGFLDKSLALTKQGEAD